tara:strand:- start:18268 stop:20004 length:1737 start_codon:yes stop_codon:yes gene_type:complete
MNILKFFKFQFFFNTYIFPIWKLLKHSNVSNKKVGLIMILTFLGSFFEGIFIFLLAPFTNSIIAQDSSNTKDMNFFSIIYNSPFILLICIIIALFIKSSLNTYKTYYVTKLIYIIRKDLRIKLIESVLDTSWKRRLEGGKLLNAYIESSTIATQTILVVNDILTNLFYVLAIMVPLLLKVSFDVIFIFFFLGIIYYCIIYFLSKKGRNLSFKNLDSNQKLSQLATEVIRGTRELQIYGFKRTLLSEMINEEDKLVKNQSISSLLLRLPSVLPSLLITLVVIYGYFSEGTENIYSISALIVTALVAVQRIGLYLSIVGQKLTMIGTGAAEINYILKVIDYKSASKGKKIKINNSDKNSISINNLTFNYGNNAELLKDLNLTFSSGKVSIILGPSGSGKSSLFSLLLKECKPLYGDIKVNDLLLEKISKSHWYSNLSFVSQTPFIFGTSILNNIKLGKSNASFNEVFDASKESGALEYINKLSKKFKFEVLDGGTNLSGGQCQLISLTRAILKDAPIVFLDEPSNNLDNLSVTRLKNILLSWANRNKLVLVITHDKRLIDERFDVYEVSDFNLSKLKIND